MSNSEGFSLSKNAFFTAVNFTKLGRKAPGFSHGDISPIFFAGSMPAKKIICSEPF
jgi:hypothetical protein